MMRGLLLSLVLAIGGALDASAGDAPVRKVFVFAGQSNMRGVGKAGQLTAGQAKLPDNVRVWAGGKWVPLVPKGNFGPEIGFVHAIAKAWPNKRIGVIKYAVGGTPLQQWAVNWTIKETDKPSPKCGRLYRKLLGAIRAAGKAGGIEFAGFLWMQGERDSRVGRIAKCYERNFKGLVAQVRADLKSPKLPVVFGLIKVPKYYKFQTEVNGALTQTGEDDPLAAAVETKDLEQHGDKLHFNTKGQLGLGARMAGEYLKLVAK
jgi:carbohydrate esterase-like sialic acid-specific acetylesterase